MDLIKYSKKINKQYFSDQLVDQVLSELNINMANQIPGKLI
jgi:hypothetical protein